MNRDDTLLPFIIASLAVLFVMLAVLLLITRGNKHVLRRKLEIGAMLLALLGLPAAACKQVDDGGVSPSTAHDSSDTTSADTGPDTTATADTGPDTTATADTGPDTTATADTGPDTTGTSGSDVTPSDPGTEEDPYATCYTPGTPSATLQLTADEDSDGVIGLDLAVNNVLKGVVTTENAYQPHFSFSIARELEGTIVQSGDLVADDGQFDGDYFTYGNDTFKIAVDKTLADGRYTLSLYFSTWQEVADYGTFPETTYKLILGGAAPADTTDAGVDAGTQTNADAGDAAVH